MISKRMLCLALLALGSASLPLAAQTSPYTRTVIIGGSGTATANGTALYNALAGISSPSSTNRWLVKIEPGIFDLGSQTLTLRDYVDIEGSGRGVTTIASTGSSTLIAPTDPSHTDIHSEVRDLLVRNTAANGNAIIVEVNGVRLTQLVAESDSSSGGTGISLIDTTARLSQVSVSATASSSSGSVAGIWIVNGLPNLQDVDVSTDGAASGIHRAIVVNGSPAWLQRITVASPVAPTTGSLCHGVVFANSSIGAVLADSQITVGADSSSGQAFGVYVTDSSAVEMRNTVVVAQNAAWSPALLVTNGSSAGPSGINVYSSRLSGQGGTGIGCQTYGAATVRFSQSSIVEGSDQVYWITTTSGGTGAILFGASQLVGNRTYGSPLASCGVSYDGVFAPIANGPC